jgi:hypothetical protein
MGHEGLVSWPRGQGWDLASNSVALLAKRRKLPQIDTGILSEILRLHY